MTTRITGTGSFVPERIVTNEELTRIVETDDQWIRSRTGIGERRIVTEQGTSAIALKAAERALENSGVKPEEIELIILATSTPDNCFPGGACEVQAGIGAVNAAAYDISAACSGFIFALNTAHAFLKSGFYKTALIIGADTLSRHVDWTDRSTCVLFGDGAGAAVLQAEDRGVLNIAMGADGSKGDVLFCAAGKHGNFLTDRKPEIGFMSMEGQEVFKFAVKKIPEIIGSLLDKQKMSTDEIKYFILHQANVRIIESAAKRLRVPIEKFPMNIEKYGNTSAASIPILLDELNRAGELEKGDKIAMAGFGAGLTWGGTLLEW